jgi:hypothetical protein
MALRVLILVLMVVSSAIVPVANVSTNKPKGGSTISLLRSSSERSPRQVLLGRRGGSLDGRRSALGWQGRSCDGVKTL